MGFAGGRDQHVVDRKNDVDALKALLGEDRKEKSATSGGGK